MQFLSPTNLWWMLALAGLPALYLWLLRRRGKPAVRLSSVHLVRQAAGPAWRRHVPPRCCSSRSRCWCWRWRGRRRG